jgi:beta-ureidopropionase
MSLVRAAMTETKNQYADMPASVDALDQLAGKLDAVRDANLDHHEALIREAAARGARLVGLGELFPGPYFALERKDLWLGLAEDPDDGPTARRMSSLAAELELVIVAPMFEQTKAGRRYNTALVFDADGAKLGQYRKSHIPFGTNEQGSFVETHYYGRGDEAPFFPVFDTAIGRLGVAICYDRHFEGVMASLAANGAQVVMSPAVTFGAKSERMWEIEFEVDAARHRLFIGGSNRKGVEPPWTIEYFGRSHFVGPDGRLPDLAADHPELVISDLDVDSLSGPCSSGWDLARDRRPAIYTRS